MGDHLKSYIQGVNLTGESSNDIKSKVCQAHAAFIMSQIFRKKRRTLAGGVIGRGNQLTIDLDDVTLQATSLLSECLVKSDFNSNIFA